MKLTEVLNQIIQEGITAGGDQTFDFSLASNSDEALDPFLINKKRKERRLSLAPLTDRQYIGSIPVYFSFCPNKKVELEHNMVTRLFNGIKSMTNTSKDALYKLILATVPERAVLRVKYIVYMESSGDLNKALVELLQRKYNIPVENITEIPKVQYRAEDMINKDKYAKADPMTRKEADYWVDRLKAKYPEATQMVIKKSTNRSMKHPGLQSGIRRLLNPTYQLQEKPVNDGVTLVVDDFILGGTSMKEVIGHLLKAGISPENLAGYCLGIHNTNLQ